MRRLKVYFLICVMGFLVSGCGGTARYNIIKGQDEIKIEAPGEELQVGEKFTYKAEWLGMDVGIATLSIEGITKKNGRSVYHILATAQSTPLISKIYKVEDRISTYLDVEELYPVRFEKRQREGGYRSDEYTDFDQKKGRAFYFSQLDHAKKEYSIPKRVHDPLSCLYYLRLQDVEIGRSIFTNVNADENNYLLETKIYNKGVIEIKDIGEWKAFMVEPLPWFQGRVKRKAKLTMWFSADKRRIPLLMTTSGIPFVGSVTITLQKIENLDTQQQ